MCICFLNNREMGGSALMSTINIKLEPTLAQIRLKTGGNRLTSDLAL